MSLENFKQAFFRNPNLVHLNNAGQSPMSRPAVKAIAQWTKRLHEEGAHAVPDLIAAVEAARADFARFVGAKAHELAYFQGASGAISEVAFGLDLKPGDEVIVWDQEYPSNFYPWSEACRISGAKLVVAKSDDDLATPVSTLEKLVTSKTKVIATSWVQFRTGAQLDLKALNDLARARGILTSVDVIQGVGCLPFDFHASGIDFACGGSHKWMAANHGAGYLLIREEKLDRLRPTTVGAWTFMTGDDNVNLEHPLRSTAARFEPGGKAFLELIALGASARLHTATGIDNISREAERLSTQLVTGLRDRGYTINSPHGEKHRGSILNFAPGPKSRLRSLDEIEALLKQKRIGFVRRTPGIRLSPHAHNSDADMDRVLKVLE